MARCEDCIHNEVCESIAGLRTLVCGYKAEERCKMFKPTAEVAEVVRCKDCKYKTVTSDGEYNPEDIVCEYFMSDGFRETDFCSFGEREK